MKMEQTVFNWAVGIAGTLSGIIITALWTAVKDLQTGDAKLTEKISQIEVLVVGNYIKRDELEKHINGLYEFLRRIEDKIDRKADK